MVSVDRGVSWAGYFSLRADKEFSPHIPSPMPRTLHDFGFTLEIFQQWTCVLIMGRMKLLWQTIKRISLHKFKVSFYRMWPVQHRKLDSTLWGHSGFQLALGGCLVNRWLSFDLRHGFLLASSCGWEAFVEAGFWDCLICWTSDLHCFPNACLRYIYMYVYTYTHINTKIPLSLLTFPVMPFVSINCRGEKCYLEYS